MTIFTDAKDNTTVLELKKIIEGKEYIIYMYCIKEILQYFILYFTKEISILLFLFFYLNFHKIYEYLININIYRF